MNESAIFKNAINYPISTSLKACVHCKLPAKLYQYQYCKTCLTTEFKTLRALQDILIGNRYTDTHSKDLPFDAKFSKKEKTDVVELAKQSIFKKR